MSNTFVKMIAVSAALFGATAVAARADCESDLGLIEAALAAPNLSAEAKGLLEAAGAAGASALRKDDDEGCNKAVMEGLAKAGTAPVLTVAAPPSEAPIGDLVPFKTIAADTLKIVKSGDLAAAKTRIKDLETAWDKSAKVMKAANIEKWNAVDKAIDSALKKLRASSPTVADSSAALQTLIGVIEKSA